MKKCMYFQYTSSILVCSFNKYKVSASGVMVKQTHTATIDPSKVIVCHLEYIVFTIVFAPLANFPTGNSIVFAPLYFIMALLTLHGRV